MLRRPYAPPHGQNRMKHEGDVVRARREFFSRRSANLRVLVEGRFAWMNRFVEPDEVGLEIGCGTGLSKRYVTRPKEIHLTDVADYEWLDFKNVDALQLPFADESYDFVICGNMIHHVAHPLALFDEVCRVLKPRGRLLVQEVNASLVMRLLLRLMRHEGYSFEPDVFDPCVVCNDPADPWSANCAIPNLLFDDVEKFHRHVPALRIIHASYSECLSMANSGGVIAKTASIPLPRWAAKAVAGVDKVLTAAAPSLFAMQRQVVLEKVAEPGGAQGVRAA